MTIGRGHPAWRTVERHLDEALECDADERAAYLEALRRAEPEIAAALAELLVTHEEVQAGGFLDTGPVGLVDASMVGLQVGAYTIESLIGRGGMGEVWVALRSDGRFEGRFAIKFLDAYSASPAALDRFRREGRLLARLTHPHIARLIDAGVAPGERPYLVLEYVAGEPIDAYCSARGLGLEDRIRLALEVLAALSHAHTNLIVHRDIKPSNVLVTADGEVKLLDFGIAKLLSADASTEGEFAPTRVEESAFTVEFAAPEQLLGEPASTATDVYQFGMLLFVLLAGRLPSPTSGVSRSERIKAALDRDPPPVSEAASKESRRALRGDLDAIVGKALRKLPAERYATAAAMADDLRRFLEHEPVRARADAVGYRMRKFARRYRGAVIGTSVAMLALIVTAAFALLQMREAQRQRDQSAAHAVRAERQAEFVTLMMSTMGGSATTGEQLLDAGEQLLEKHYFNDPTFRANSLLNLSARYNDLGSSTKADAAVIKALGIARDLDDPALIARAECDLALDQAEEQRDQEAAAHLASAKAAMARIAIPGALLVDECMESESVLMQTRGNRRGAALLGDRALTVLEQAGEVRDIRYSRMLGRIAEDYNELGETQTAFTYEERALTAVEDNGTADTDNWAAMAHNVALGLSRFGEIKESCEREGRIVERIQASGKVVIAAIAIAQGDCLYRQERWNESLTWFDKAVEAARSEDPLMLLMNASAYRARALTALNRLAEADEQLVSCERLAAEPSARQAYFSTRVHLSRIEWLLAKGRPDDAQRAIDPILREVRNPDSKKRSSRAGTELLAAKIALTRKRGDEAAQWAAAAVEDYKLRARNPAISADVGEALLMLARAHALRSDAEHMHESARMALPILSASLGPLHASTLAAAAMQ